MQNAANTFAPTTAAVTVVENDTLQQGTVAAGNLVAVTSSIEVSVPTAVSADGVITAGVTATPAVDKKAGQKQKFNVPVKFENAVQEVTLVAKERNLYVNEFKSFRKKTAESTLEMCRTVYEAKKMLDECEFDEFCKQIGYKDTSSTIRKFISIGKVYPRLIDLADQLPAAWTSIYDLTQIPADEFEKCVKGGFSLNKLSGSEVKKLVMKTRDINDITSPFKMEHKFQRTKAGAIYFTKKPDDLDWRAVEKAFEEVCARLPVRLELDKDVKELFAERRAKTYEKAKVKEAGHPLKAETWDLGKASNEASPQQSKAA